MPSGHSDLEQYGAFKNQREITLGGFYGTSTDFNYSINFRVMAIKVTSEFKEKVVEAMKVQRQMFDGTNGAFAKMFGMSASIFSRIINGERESVLTTVKWLMLGQALGI